MKEIFHKYEKSSGGWIHFSFHLRWDSQTYSSIFLLCGKADAGMNFICKLCNGICTLHRGWDSHDDVALCWPDRILYLWHKLLKYNQLNELIFAAKGRQILSIDFPTYIARFYLYLTNGLPNIFHLGEVFTTRMLFDFATKCFNIFLIFCCSISCKSCLF